MARQAASINELQANPEAEEAVLGSILIDRMAIYTVRSLLGADDFTSMVRRGVYEAMLAVTAQGKALDYVAVVDELERAGHPDWGSQIAGLINRVPTSVHAEHYARIVRDWSLRRHITAAAGEIARLSSEEPDAQSALSKALNAMSSVNQAGSLRMQTTSQAVDELSVQLQDWLDHPADVWGLPTGLLDLDRLTGGLEAGEMVVVAARPGMGKSALALQIARHVAESGRGVAFFSLEMSQRQLMLRLVCAGAHIDNMAIRHGKLDAGQREQLWQEMGHLQTLPIWWCCRSQLTIAEAQSEVAKLQTRQDVALVVFDYLQLARSDGENQNIRITHVSQALKTLAVDQNVCVLVASQLNREIERRGASAEPQLADIRDSGSIEQDADKVLFIYRSGEEIKFKLAKNRSGKANTGVRDVVFLESYAVFADAARPDQSRV